MASDLDLEGSVGFGHAGKRNSRHEGTVGERPRDVQGGVEPVEEGRRVIVGDRRGKKGCRGPGESFDLLTAEPRARAATGLRSRAQRISRTSFPLFGAVRMDNNK